MKKLMLVLIAIVQIGFAADTTTYVVKSKKDTTCWVTLKMWDIIQDTKRTVVAAQTSMILNKSYKTWYGADSTKSKCSPVIYQERMVSIGLGRLTIENFPEPKSIKNLKLLYMLKLVYDSGPDFCGYDYYDTLSVDINWPAILNTAVEKQSTITTQASSGPLSIYDISGRLVDHAVSKEAWKTNRAGVYLGRYKNGKAVKIVRM